jgi:hypothetical protein
MSAAPSAVVIGQSRSAARILTFGGILLVIAGMLLGEVFAIFISHVASAQIRREWVAIVHASAEHDTKAAGAGFDRIQNLLERKGRIMDTHSHMIAYGFLALTLALLQPASKLSERTRWWMAVCIVAGGLVQCLFIFVSYYTHGWALELSDIGGALLLIGILANIAGLVGSRDHHNNIRTGAASVSSSPSSRILLRTGAFLILVGMVFGFYYAWVFVTQHEPQQMSLLDRAFNSTTSGDTVATPSAISTYRQLQSRIAIVTAAHSHIIEMGILAMLLGFLQDSVFLSPMWKRRWAIVFSVGSAVMPVCTYIASLTGLVAAGFADAFGLLSIVALFAILFGLVRYTGAQEGKLAA